MKESKEKVFLLGHASNEDKKMIQNIFVAIGVKVGGGKAYMPMFCNAYIYHPDRNSLFAVGGSSESIIERYGAENVYHLFPESVAELNDTVSSSFGLFNRLGNKVSALEYDHRKVNLKLKSDLRVKENEYGINGSVMAGTNNPDSESYYDLIKMKF